MKSCWALLILLFVTYTVTATPIQWRTEDGGNNHWYDIVYNYESLTWEEAKSAAENLYFEGYQGHLLTITSQAEAMFSFQLHSGEAPVPEKHRLWIGGFQPIGSPEPAGNWQWVTGEVMSYTGWQGIEPNNQTGDEDVLHISFGSMYWNDVNRDFTGWNGGYLVEYPVPEPATLLLLGLGTLALRKCRK